MTSTVLVTVPLATVTLDTTVQRTSFVTVEVTYTADGRAQSSSPPLSEGSSAGASDISTLLSTTEASSTSSSISLPVVETGVAPTSFTTRTTTSSSGSLTTYPTGTAVPNANSISDKQLQRHQKQVIIGGLCGAIAGLLLIAILIFAFLHLRQRRKTGSDAEAPAPENEKSLRAAIVFRWTDKLFVGSPMKRGAHGNANTSPVTVDEDHHIIRMSTQHWPRPYARGEGYRDSLPPGVLRVTNPDDHSLPPTPRESSDTVNGTGSFRSFLRRPKPAFAASGTFNLPRSRASSRATQPPSRQQQQQHPLAQEVPTITIDPSPSSECVMSSATGLAEHDHSQHSTQAHQAASTPAPSFSSYPSLASLRNGIVQQKPPEDPFVVHQPPGTSQTVPVSCYMPRPPPLPQHARPTGDRFNSRPRRPSMGSTVDSAKTRLGAFLHQPFRMLGGAATTRPRAQSNADAPADGSARDTRRDTAGMSHWSSSTSDGRNSHVPGVIRDSVTGRSRSGFSLTHWSQRRASDPFDLDRASLRSGYVPPSPIGVAVTTAAGPPTPPPKEKEKDHGETSRMPGGNALPAPARIRMYEGT